MKGGRNGRLAETQAELRVLARENAAEPAGPRQRPHIQPQRLNAQSISGRKIENEGALDFSGEVRTNRRISPKNMERIAKVVFKAKKPSRSRSPSSESFRYRATSGTAITSTKNAKRAELVRSSEGDYEPSMYSRRSQCSFAAAEAATEDQAKCCSRTSGDRPAKGPPAEQERATKSEAENVQELREQD